MDLKSFTSKKETSNLVKVYEKNKTVINSNAEEIEFNFEEISELETFENFLFFSPTNSIIINSETELENYFRKSISDGVEGLMVKNLDETYKPGLRTGAMAKLKEVREDIDAVIIAGEYGQGKRAGFFSSFYIAIKSEQDEDLELYTIGKVSSGVKEVDQEGPSLEKINLLLKPLIISEEGSTVQFKPEVVIQVRYQEIQKSTTYSSGYALRFPRIISIRDDKSIDEINSIEDIKRFV